MYRVIKAGGALLNALHENATLKKANWTTYTSPNWKVWRAIVTARTCYYCASMHGRIFSSIDPQIYQIPVHPNCRCFIEKLIAILVGTATLAGINGVDIYVWLHGTLPSYYLKKKEAEKLGWKSWLGNLADVLPGKMIGGMIYKNRDHRLPEKPGRIWYEADFDYVSGIRNGRRLLYSNDGLLFAAYNHYRTFYEIGWENLL